MTTTASGHAQSNQYDAALAAQLVNLATLANQSLDNLFLPGEWGLSYTYTSSSAYGSCQYYLAVYPKSQPTLCALVVGAPWSSFISYYTPDDNHMLTAVSNAIVGNNSDVISADTGFVQMYGAIRKRLWSDIESIKQTIPAFSAALPLVVVGLGPGAPVAQLASLDLRPDKTLSPSQVSTLSSYVFSCPPAVDPAFASFFAANVTAGYRVLAATDQFPSQPLPASGYVVAGSLQSLASTPPVYDCPWLERDGPYYRQLLTHTAPVQSGTGSTGNVNGFDPLVAFSMAQLSAVAYQMYQHPSSSVGFNYAPYVLKQNVSINGVVWASVFEGPDNLVVAWRGTVTWMELINLTSNAFPSTPAWITSGYGQYSSPLAELYGNGRDQLRTVLNGLGNKPLMLTGHDCGGALANLMAVDQLQNPLQGQRVVTGVYTFGTPPAADVTFVRSFTASSLASICFQVVRPLDVMPKLPLLGFLFTLGNSVTLSGGDFNEYNGTTFHALPTYLDLLNQGN